MARNEKAKQINFIPAEDIAEKLEQSENKTKVINEALRMYFSTDPHRLKIIERIQKLEEFQNRFMAYYKRKDNETHSEFCDCEMCKSNRRSFAKQRVVSIDPEPQTGEKMIAVIKRGIEQADRMNVTVALEHRSYQFRLSADSNAEEEYAQYLNSVEDNVSVSIPNPLLQ